MKQIALQKLSRAARLSAEAAKLYAEAAQELSCENESQAIASRAEIPRITEVDQARARRALKKAGARI